jgi:hypothetical protein
MIRFTSRDGPGWASMRIEVTRHKIGSGQCVSIKKDQYVAFGSRRSGICRRRSTLCSLVTYRGQRYYLRCFRNCPSFTTINSAVSVWPASEASVRRRRSASSLDLMMMLAVVIFKARNT